MKEMIVRKSIDIHASVPEVWAVIASPDAMKRWMLVEPALETEGPLQLRSKLLWKEGSGKTYLTGTVEALEECRKLVIGLEDVSWARKAKPGEVTYALTLSERASGARVEFELGDLSIDPESQAWYDAYNDGRELESIKDMVERHQ